MPSTRSVHSFAFSLWVAVLAPSFGCGDDDGTPADAGADAATAAADTGIDASGDVDSGAPEIDASMPRYSVSFSVTGLDATALSAVRVQINGGEEVSASVDALGYVFPTPLADGTPYEVAIVGQPTGQHCTLMNERGTISGADVTDVAVTCMRNVYTVSFSVSGLDPLGMSAVHLQINGGETASTASNGGRFTFPTPLMDGEAYDVEVLFQPTGQTCTVSNGTGTIMGADVTDIAVTCAPT